MSPHRRPSTPIDLTFWCARDADCAGHAEGVICEVAQGRCVQRRSAVDTCPAGQFCLPGTNACAVGCRNDEGCDVVTRTSVECLADGHVGSPARRAPATACALRALQACGGNADCASATRSAAGRCSFRTDVSAPWLDACQGADHTASIVRVPGVSAGTDPVTALPRTAQSRPSQAANCDAGPVSARAATTAAR